MGFRYDTILTSDFRHIDVTLDFTMDTKDFWTDYWADNPFGKIKKDPDGMSDSLRVCHQRLYRRNLPDGTLFDLRFDFKPKYIWNGIKLSNDTIVTPLNFKNYPLMQTMKDEPGFRANIEDFMHRAYTIGGEIIFPVHGPNSINPVRGKVADDRFDLTLLCIQRYYEGSDDLPDKKGLNWLLDAIRFDSKFFDAFGSFRGYVDFFFLNGLVDGQYNTVLWIDNPERPRDREEYELFMRKQMAFLADRNRRISEYEL